MSVLRDLDSYVRLDRAGVVAAAQAAGVYRRPRDPLVIGARCDECRMPGSARRVVHLTPDERRCLLVDGPEGPEPAAFWPTGLRPLEREASKGRYRQGRQSSVFVGATLPDSREPTFLVHIRYFIASNGDFPLDRIRGQEDCLTGDSNEGSRFLAQ